MASIDKRPDGMWRVRYRDPGGKQRAKHFARKADAQHWRDQITSAMTDRTWTAPERGRVPVADWAEQWLATQSQLKPSTRYRYGSLLRNQILPHWGTWALTDISHGEVAAWVAELAATGLSASTVRQAHRVLSLILTLAVRDNRIPRNPAAGVPLPRIQRQEIRFLRREEVAGLARAAGEDSDIIWLLALTGLRFGEAAALRVGRVDLVRGRLRIAESATEVAGVLVIGTPKTHQARTVPVPADLRETLARRCAGKAPDDFVLSRPRGGPLRLRNFRRDVFDPAARAAGIHDISPHDLRHTAASLLVAAGANVKVVQRMLGHASAAMTLDVYAGLFEDDLDALASLLHTGDGLSASSHGESPRLWKAS